MQRYNQRLVEELKNRQTQERARLPKIQRSEAKTRMAMFKKSLRINSSSTPEQDREKVKQVTTKKGQRVRPEIICVILSFAPMWRGRIDGNDLHRHCEGLETVTVRFILQSLK